jgi:hypothetical protein
MSKPPLTKPIEPTKTKIVTQSFRVCDESIQRIIDQLPKNFDLNNAIVTTEDAYGDAYGNNKVVVEYDEEITLTDKEFAEAQVEYEKRLKFYNEWLAKQQELKDAKDKIKSDPEYKEFLKLQKKFKDIK